jgi:hemolysin activation/secretion protein
MRRRPLRRAAVVGGVAVAAHHAGTKSAQAAAAEDQQNQQIADLQAQEAQPQYAPEPQYAPPPAAPAVGGDDMVAQLENLKKLLDEGVLTQAEFDMQKQKLLSAS